MSKLSTFVLDCRTSDRAGLEGAAQFWSKALGRPLRAPQPGDDRYRDLACAPGEPLLMIQRVEHESRIHLDIESEDIDAEVARLEALGARRIERVRTWVVMEAPTGQRFCVVRPQRAHAEAPAFTKATEQHARLGRLAGHYRGETRTWMDADGEPEVGEGGLYVEPVLGGRWLRLQQHGTVAGTRHAGEMLLGYHVDAAEYELSWVDSFHTGSAMLISKGAQRPDGVVSVLGSYQAGDQRWGWRTELHLGETLVVRAFNISPSGEESRATETEWRRI